MSNTEILIRSATLSDLPTLLEFEQGVISAERPFALNLRPGNINYYDIQELIESDQAEVVVAESEQRLVASGYAKFQDSKPHIQPARYAYLGFMYVAPDRRGEKIVGKIIDSLMQWSKSHGVDAFELEVFAENASAVRAYEKLGFKANMVQMLKL